MDSDQINIKKTIFAEVMGIVENTLSWENFTSAPFIELYGEEQGDELIRELRQVSSTKVLNDTMKELLHNPLSWKDGVESMNRLPQLFTIMDGILNELVGERMAETNNVKDSSNIEQVRLEYQLNSTILRVILAAPTSDEDAHGLMKELMGDKEGELFMSDLNEYASNEENREFLKQLTSDIELAEETLRSSGPRRELLLFIASIVIALQERTDILTAHEDEKFLHDIEGE